MTIKHKTLNYERHGKMTYKEYSNQISAYESAVSNRKSLLMTIRMNKTWLTSKTSKRGLKRLAVIESAQKQLASLVIPAKPIQPLGYEVIDDCDDCFVGFWTVDDISLVKTEAFEILGHNNFTLNRKPRFRD